MSKITGSFISLALIALFVTPAFADYKIRQQITMNAGGTSFTREGAIWVKGMRERSEARFVDEQMAQMMPLIAEVKQCDQRQTLKINDQSRKYFIEPFYVDDQKSLPAERSTPTASRTRVGGEIVWTYTFTDTGERRQMFGFQARRFVIKQLAEASKNSCGGESRMQVEEDGWFVNLMPENAVCPVQLPRGEGSGPTNSCRDKVTIKGTFRYPGLMLEGTTKMIDLLGKDEMVTSVKTLELSKATLEMSIFEIPNGYTEVNSEQSLMSIGNMAGNITGMNVGPKDGQAKTRKAVAIDFFSGSVAKINQPSLRQMIAGQVSAKGLNGVLVSSQSEIASGAYQYVVGVEVKSVKESGAAKIGGLFGKVTGNDDAAKVGKSEAEVIVTLYSGDGKTVVATGSAKEKVDGKSEDAARAAIEKALTQVLPMLK